MFTKTAASEGTSSLPSAAVPARCARARDNTVALLLALLSFHRSGFKRRPRPKPKNETTQRDPTVDQSDKVRPTTKTQQRKAHEIRGIRAHCCRCAAPRRHRWPKTHNRSSRADRSSCRLWWFRRAVCFHGVFKPSAPRCFTKVSAPRGLVAISLTLFSPPTFSTKIWERSTSS